ncbi:hypothetical protein SAMN05444387_0183 [Flavobacterium pectinovorum]|uniref:Uncharacterized protein n=1 Tax=Flavobacterium pectinovorum TaxID=29533 RepID=A0ABY1IWZ4_9FLAO|nr:hypothetical protein SAMN05444387_0183 [Flavobacterium pectinovorum]
MYQKSIFTYIFVVIVEKEFLNDNNIIETIAK